VTAGESSTIDTALTAEVSAQQVAARAVADAVLYEGYILYPYRASAQKNHSRWQFGVVMPADYAAVEPNETAISQTECLLEADDTAEITVVVRYLQVQRRRPQNVDGAPVESLTVDETSIAAWDEAVEHEIAVRTCIADLRAAPMDRAVSAPDIEECESVRDANGQTAGRLVRRRERLDGTVTIAAAPVPGPWRAWHLRVRITNRSRLGAEPGTRDGALPVAFIAVHTIVSVREGAFISLLEPPEWARVAVDACRNIGTFPVLAGVNGRRDVVLSSPIILYDHPTIAPESPGDLYDSTEIDEILTLRTLALTDDEKAAARVTDPRAAAIIDRVDAMDAATMDRLHGAIRYLRQVTGDPSPRPPDDPTSRLFADDVSTDDVSTDDVSTDATPAEAARIAVGAGADGPNAPPWWDPDADASVSPETDAVTVNGTKLRRGSAVRLRPGPRRADAQDMFLVGRPATIEAVLFDIDDQPYFALTLDEDPSADLQRSHGRFLYFTPDEVEPA
jgi:hypothetical protein